MSNATASSKPADRAVAAAATTPAAGPDSRVCRRFGRHVRSAAVPPPEVMTVIAVSRSRSDRRDRYRRMTGATAALRTQVEARSYSRNSGTRALERVTGTAIVDSRAAHSRPRRRGGVGEQQAHRDGARLQTRDRLDHPRDLGVGERDDDRTIRGAALVHRHDVTRGDEVGWPGDPQVVQRRAVLPGDREQVGEAPRRDEHRPSDITFEHGVGGRRRPVAESPDVRPRRHRRQSLGHALALVLGRGRDLSSTHRLIHDGDDIGERPTDIDAGCRGMDTWAWVLCGVIGRARYRGPSPPGRHRICMDPVCARLLSGTSLLHTVTYTRGKHPCRWKSWGSSSAYRFC
jgi:hypothetical protein